MVTGEDSKASNWAGDDGMTEKLATRAASSLAVMLISPVSWLLRSSAPTMTPADHLT